jgi:hypothetical protein
MKKITVALNTLSMLIFGLTVLQAQETVSASGGNTNGSGGTVSYTVGQVFYTNNTSSTGTATQGVQQPYEFFIVTGIEAAKDINLICSSYPNPITDFVKLKVENYKVDNLSYQLYDMNGKLLQNRKVNGNETTIPMGDFVPSTYFLKVVQTLNAASQKEVKTFKIIKQ